MRRYQPLKPSRGTVIPADVRTEVMNRDRGCVGHRVLGMPGPCTFGIELDHVRASHGIGLKSETTARNLISLCPLAHRLKTDYGKTWRPLLLEYLARFDVPA